MTFADRANHIEVRKVDAPSWLMEVRLSPMPDTLRHLFEQILPGGTVVGVAVTGPQELTVQYEVDGRSVQARLGVLSITEVGI